MKKREERDGIVRTTCRTSYSGGTGNVGSKAKEGKAEKRRSRLELSEPISEFEAIFQVSGGDCLG